MTSTRTWQLVAYPVSGDANELPADDFGVPGVYDVFFSDAIDDKTVLDSDLAVSVLDSFHSTVPIASPDVVEIEIFVDGESVPIDHESEGAPSSFGADILKASDDWQSFFDRRGAAAQSTDLLSLDPEKKGPGSSNGASL